MTTPIRILVVEHIEDFRRATLAPSQELVPWCAGNMIRLPQPLTPTGRGAQASGG
jgi:hypothetical protein